MSIDMLNVIISLVTGLLGGVIVTIVSHFLTRKKTAAEVKKIEAETEKIRVETRAIMGKVDSLYESIGQQIPLELHRTFFADKPVKISASRKNLFSIPSDFLQWEKCTVILWVNVPPKGQGVRNTDSYRYIIAHITEVVNKEQGWPYSDRFSLGHFTNDVWSVTISSSKAKEKDISIEDGLEPGWHQFFIAWDHTKPILDFAIDGGEGGRQLSTEIIAYWPGRVSEKVILGSWVSGWEGHYCETELYKVAIYKQYLDFASETVKAHANFKPVL